MTEINISIDLNGFCRLSPSSRISLLEGAMMFGAIPEANIPYTKSYIKQLTTTIIDPVQKKTLILEGGIHKLASVIRENFPHMIELRGDISSEKLQDFADKHQISHEDFVGCSGTDSQRYYVTLICFRNSSDAILAKLYFKDAVLYKTNQGPEQIEIEITKKGDGKYNIMNDDGDDDCNDDCDCNHGDCS